MNFNGTIGRAMPLSATLIGSIDARPAWVFENQSGTLGTNLKSSVIYCGDMPADDTGSLSVILPGISLDSVATLIDTVNRGVPVASQAITFVGLQSGSILPVAVDYVTAVAGTGVVVGNFIVSK